MRFRLIEDQREMFPVRVMCDVMGVSPAGYYAWRGQPESPGKAANRALLTGIQRVHAAHRGRYGAPRIHAALHAEGHKASPAALNGSCVIMASRHKPSGGSGCVPRTAITIGPLPPTGSTAISLSN